MEKFRHLKPPEQTEVPQESGVHTIELLVEGRQVGVVDFKYKSRPIPHYEINSLFIEKDDRGKGYGSLVMKQIEDLLLKQHKAGVLQDFIEGYEHGNAAEALGMYERRGWVRLPTTPILDRCLAYNLPKGLSPNEFAKLLEGQYQKEQVRLQNMVAERTKAALETHSETDN